jgi:protein phosphatase
MSDEAKERWREAVSRPLLQEAFHPLSSAVAVEIAAASASGRQHPRNTDHYLAVRIGRLQETLVTSLAAADLPAPFEEYAYALVVADGLGELDAGTRASRVALSALAHLALRYGRWNVRVRPDTLAEIAEQGEFFYRQVNDAVRLASQADFHLEDMATSLTALYIAEGDLFFWHVGHSRAFLFRNGTLLQLTTDHTLAEGTRDPSGSHAARVKLDVTHRVTKSVGARPTGPEVDVEHVTLAFGDRLLLCTNGLTDVASDDQIADQLAQQRSPAEDCRQLIELARAGDSPDDVTVLVAHYTRRDGHQTAPTDGFP